METTNVTDATRLMDVTLGQLSQRWRSDMIDVVVKYLKMQGWLDYKAVKERYGIGKNMLLGWEAKKLLFASRPGEHTTLWNSQDIERVIESYQPKRIQQ